MTEVDLTALVADAGVESVRVLFVDAHGLTRGKSIDPSAVGDAVEHGLGVPGSLLHKDTGNTYALSLWEPTGDAILDELLGARNMVLHPDPTTFRVLPWAPTTGWVLSDLSLTDGTPIPHSSRAVARRAIDMLAESGYGYRAGLELEFTVFHSDGGDGSPARPIHPGWDLLGEQTLEIIEPLLAPVRRGLSDLGLTPRSLEAELGPGQVELTFGPATGIDVADQAVLARSAIRAISAREGLHATFMSRPAPEGLASFPSGWHLHQSLRTLGDDRSSSAENAFAPPAGGEPLSPVGRHVVAGLLTHAAGACMLTTPTVNGYKRYRPRAVTPDRITWSRDHRGAMLRIISGGPGDAATRIENRAGDPAANPYLFLASQVHSALAGITTGAEPPTATDSPYDDPVAQLPRSLGEAIDAFAADPLWPEALGVDVAEYLLGLARSNWRRFLTAVTDWEQTEYFRTF